MRSADGIHSAIRGAILEVSHVANSPSASDVVRAKESATLADGVSSSSDPSADGEATAAGISTPKWWCSPLVPFPWEFARALLRALEPLLPSLDFGNEEVDAAATAVDFGVVVDCRICS